jgi:hypothetical protein
VKFQNLSVVFLWSFVLFILIFIPTHSLEELTVRSVLSWVGISILIILIIKNLLKSKLSEYKELYIAVKGKFKTKELIESKTSVRLVFSGGACWFLILIFKSGLLPIPLFIIGATLMIWGLSHFLEENGLYKFSESSLSNKWILSALGSIVLYWSAFKSAGQVNSVFNIDPGFFPFTLTAMALFNIATLLFLLMIPVFIISGLIMLCNFVREVFFKKKKKNELMIFTGVLVFSAYASLFSLFMLSPTLQDKAVNSIALQTDFNSSHTCDDEWLKDKPVIFVGPNSNYVLATSQDHEGKYTIQRCISL